MDMDEFGMGSPIEAFVLSGNCEVLGLDTCSGKFIRRISSSCCSNIISAFADARMLMRGLNPRVANSPSFSILIILNPTQFQGSERFSFVILSWTTRLILRKVQLKRVLSEQLQNNLMI
uniref:Uncharacterized protein n=1 Tax=Brassica oleracea TaxID=3712 RepID=A0A3P6DZR6_BRAOL|nr:unnamed protein product [Brassica oleracea]